METEKEAPATTYISTQEAATLLGLTVGQVQHILSIGKIEGHKQPGPYNNNRSAFAVWQADLASVLAYRDNPPARGRPWPRPKPAPLLKRGRGRPRTKPPGWKRDQRGRHKKRV